MARSGRAARGVMVALIAVVVAAGSCTAARAQPSEQPTSAPPATPSPKASGPADCFEFAIPGGYGAPSTINDVRALAVDAVVGKFTGFGEARWNTPGGVRPTRDELQSKPARLYRPVSFGITKALLGSSDPATFSIRGGSLGCDTITYDDGIVLKEGVTYVAVFMPIDDSEGKPSGRPSLLAAWPVEADGTVHTTADGDLSLAEVESALATGIKETPAPSPGEMSPPPGP